MKLKKVIAAVSAAAMVIGCLPNVWAESADVPEEGVSVLPADYEPVTYNIAEITRDGFPIVNPYTEDAVITEVELPEKTKDISVCFDVDNADTNNYFSAWCVFAGNEWETRAYTEDDYDMINGIPEFVFGKNGSYELIIPIGLFLEEDDDYDYLDALNIIDMKLEGDVKSSKATITVTDIKAYQKSHTIEECTYIDDEIKLDEPTEPEPAEPEPAKPDKPDGESDGFQYKDNKDGTLTIMGYKGEEKNVVVPSEINEKKVTKIGDWAFSNCTFITSVKIPDSVTVIGNAVFSGCSSLILVEIPDSAMIGNGFMAMVFNGCTSLTSAEVPDGVTWIEPGTFNGCTSLTSVIIPKSVNAIGYEKGGEANAFEECPNIIIYGYSNSYAEEYAAKYKIPFVAIDDSVNIQISNGIEVTIPDVSDATLEDKTLEVKLQASDENLISFNITLRDKEGNEVQPGGEVTVKIPVPAYFNGEECNVYRKETDGTYTNMKAEYKNGCMIFTTGHFSEYVLSDKELEPDTPAPDVTTTTDSGTTSDEGATTTAPSNTNNGANNDGNVSTGVALAIVPVIAAGAAVVIFSKKRK